jgi:hypothetical protein
MLSVSSTPILLNGEPTGPMEKGITYIVRPRIAPRRISPARRYPSSGDIQLFVGPASSRSAVQMKVRSSVLATSLTAVRW